MAGSIQGRWGSVLTPSLIGVDVAGHLPNASTFCGKCESVCPVKIPLPKMMRHWRERQWERGFESRRTLIGLKLWAYVARRPALYRWGADWRPASSATRAARAGICGVCRWPAAGPRGATCRRPRVAAS